MTTFDCLFVFSLSSACMFAITTPTEMFSAAYAYIQSLHESLEALWENRKYQKCLSLRNTTAQLYTRETPYVFHNCIHCTHVWQLLHLGHFRVTAELFLPSLGMQQENCSLMLYIFWINTMYLARNRTKPWHFGIKEWTLDSVFLYFITYCLGVKF